MGTKRAEASSLSLAELQGIGAKKQALLGKLNIQTVRELLMHRPRRYEDRSMCCTVAEAQSGVPSVFRGVIRKIKVKRFRHRRGSLVEMVLSDSSGDLTCRWWNQPYVARNLSEGMELIVFGTPHDRDPSALDHPELEAVEAEAVEAEDEDGPHVHRIVPIYPLTQGLTQRWLRSFIWKTLHAPAARIGPPQTEVPNRSPISHEDALFQLHFPDSLERLAEVEAFFSEEELLSFQVKLQKRRLRFNQRASAPQCSHDNELARSVLRRLPFKLTQAQSRVMREIRSDLNHQAPMRRLLQGDVGSGKTVIAALTSLFLIEGGYDVAFMAPTELLAEQHFKTLSQWMTPTDANLALRTANRHEGDPSETPTLTVGTHALLESHFEPKRLGLVIIDEQHRFGVSQRDRLLRKGSYPHLLTMTATPIPRSLGLTVYGDLEQSILDEVPKNRGRIHTHLRRADRRDRIWNFIEQQVQQGRQAFIVYPRIGAEGDDSMKAVEPEFIRLQQRFPQLRIASLHGQMDRAKAGALMDAFRKNEIHILVTTSVIEVGVDIPNATVMLIENAERFGLAQLHQLRGRIGRGSEESHCILVSHDDNDKGWARLQTMETNRDGFSIAEFDMKTRGPGEFLGKQQSGLPRFRFADLIRDRELVSEIRSVVRTALGLEEGRSRNESLVDTKRAPSTEQKT